MENIVEYKGITFLVGRNNARKSTLVKALLLITDYFKSGKIESFSSGNWNLSLEEITFIG